MGARGSVALHVETPTYDVEESERQAGEHCYLKTLIWCVSHQVKTVVKSMSRAGTRWALQPRMESAPPRSCLRGCSGSDR